MISRGLFLLTVLSNCVLSLPVTSSQLENDDVQVMKCIVEALADVLSRPRLLPISQECLVVLKTDDRLLTILRHHNFLKELQEIAVGGGQERALLQGLADDPTPTTKALHTTDDSADRSMLDALGGPGERSILSQRKRAGDRRAGKDASREDDTSRQDNESEEVEVKRGKDEAANEEEEGYDNTQANSEEKSEEENKATDQRGDGSDEKGAPSRNKSTKRMYEVSDEGENDRRSAPLSQKHNSKEEGEEKHGRKRGGQEDLKLWNKRAKSLQLKKKAIRKEEHELRSQQEVPRHSKEVNEEEEKKRDAERSPEEKELQLIAHRSPEGKTEMEEEGSGSRKSEEPEIESLAAIESELENVAQKLHGLRRG
uniref:Chromogranin-A n=1 Tax=Iconisemion striatum TaxID=60296 RepID=A0A1A7XHD6_9TELE